MHGVSNRAPRMSPDPFPLGGSQMGAGSEVFGKWMERFPTPSGDDFKSSASFAAKEERSSTEFLSHRGIEDV